MLPRFCNPHILKDNTRIISRAQLQNSGHECDAEPAEMEADIPILTKRLWNLVTDELGDTASAALEMDIRRRKRSKANDATEDREDKKTSIQFRLLSSWTAPQTVILDPKPLPLIRSVQPENEDNKAQAKQRMKQSRIVAVESDWIFEESCKLFPPSKLTRGEMIYMKASPPIPIPPTVTMITECVQHPRTSRPPVSAKSRVISIPSPAARPDLPIVPVEYLKEFTNSRPSRSRHRRGKRVTKEKTQPSFWRSDPALRGKGMGYALGYPGSWSALSHSSKLYERDTMRRGIHAVDEAMLTGF